MNKEVIISKNTANKIVKDYYNNYYDGLVNIKTKVKIENNDLYIILKKYTKLNGRVISLSEKLNEGQISFIIRKYMSEIDCYVDNIIYEPYFHNLIIRHHGNDFDYKAKSERELSPYSYKKGLCK